MGERPAPMAGLPAGGWGHGRGRHARARHVRTQPADTGQSNRGSVTRRYRGGWARHRLLLMVAILTIAALAAGGAFAVVRSRSSSASTASGRSSKTGGVHTVALTSKPDRLHVVTTDPSPRATAVPSNATLTVTLSAPLSPNSPMPTLSPPLPGAWSMASPTELQFVGAGPLTPGSTETITVPGGPTGLKGVDGRRLASSVTVPFTVAPGSELRLQQLLAELGYLPVSFVPSAPLAAPQDEAEPQPGTFAWRWGNQPSQLTSLWTPGASNLITKGAVMTFEAQNNLSTDGEAGPQVWSALLAMLAAGQSDPQPYWYVFVQSALPQNVTVYQDGAPVYNTPANTGVAAAPTAPGTYPIFERFVTTTMSGTNPNGSHYVDPGIPWTSYFNGGDALHGYVRASYGFPQSDGCVEMPPANAGIVYQITNYGTLVTVA